MDISWEWVIVDDHSNDSTFEEVEKISTTDSHVRGLRLSRNFGSHTAISCGLAHARGSCAVVMAADLQDPPESLKIVLDEWRKGFQVVWAARVARPGEKKSTILFSRLFFFMMRNIVGIKNMPPTGADFFLLDRLVVEAFAQFYERNLSIAALINWMGFRQSTVLYDKEARKHGSSGWTLRKKINILVDSITSFSFLPIRIISLSGMLLSLFGFLYAFVVIWNGLNGKTPEGWSSLMVVVLIIGGGQMLMLGVLGEYLWRALDEARRRPRYLIENATKLQTTYK